ncbi:pyridoxine 5'-phosphate synthase [Spirochaetota bacterium]|nr:pyridoxine 5'-phosphate synthase [Spirochaetota bacterium]
MFSSPPHTAIQQYLILVKKNIHLSVNLNKIALLRNARNEGIPDLITASKVIIANGADGLTVHPRPDRRHIHFEDVSTLSTLAKKQSVEFNIEGNPLAHPRPGYPGLLEIVKQTHPTQVTLVPDEDQQLTSNHGWSLATMSSQLKTVMSDLKKLDTPEHPLRISLFMDAEPPPAKNSSHTKSHSDTPKNIPVTTTTPHPFVLAKSWGADRIELYTKSYVDAYATAKEKTVLMTYTAASDLAVKEKLLVNAGHDLNQKNLYTLATHLHGLKEVSIGHALINDALYDGLAKTVRSYKNILLRASDPLAHL